MSDMPGVVVVDLALVAWLVTNGHQPLGHEVSRDAKQVEFRFALTPEELRTLSAQFKATPEKRFFSTYLDMREVVITARRAAEQQARTPGSKFPA